jgi:uncharacterized protein
MSLSVNLRHLEAHEVHLQGELPVKELDIDTRDEMVQVAQPLEYDLEVEKLDGGLLAQGKLGVTLQCKCVRCLKSFKYRLKLENWSRHLPLQGEESVPVVNDCIDLTPLVREDILLEFPQHPLCNPQCRGLPNPTAGKGQKPGGADQSKSEPSAWAELNKLKF